MPTPASTAPQPRVVRIAQSLKPSGRTLTMLSIHRSLAASYDQQLWVLDKPQWETVPPPNRFFPHTRGLSPGLVVTLARALRAIRPAIVHTHGVKADVYGAFAAKIARVPVLFSTCHRSDRSQEPTFLSAVRNRFAWQLADRIICVSGQVADHLRRKYRFSPGKLLQIHVGIDLAPFLAVPETPPPTTGRRRILLCTCHLRPEKNHDLLLHAFAAVTAEFHDVDLWLAGQAEPGRREELLALCATLGISDRVVFLGRHDDVIALLTQCAMLVHPTRAEALGRSLIEATAAARPVVATRVGGIPEVINDGKNGILVHPDDVHGFAQAIGRLLRTPQLALSMGRAGREHARKHFSLDTMTEAYRHLYAAGL